jgi:hypothetical protein
MDGDLALNNVDHPFGARVEDKSVCHPHKGALLVCQARKVHWRHPRLNASKCPAPL